MSLTSERFCELVGYSVPQVSFISSRTEVADGYDVEHIRLQIGEDEVRGILTRPQKATGPMPAILYAHAHGGAYDIGARELLDGRKFLLDPLGPVFAREGYVTLAIDMPAFGERAIHSESSLAKAALWYGRGLFSKMLSDLGAALSYLASRSDVDATRIGAFGISMGCTLSYWLAAADVRIAAVAHLCCFADIRTLINSGAHDRHGIYLIVPGLLTETDAGAIAALVAPRPQLICIGADDHLTPPLAVSRALDELRPAYNASPDMLTVMCEQGVGHQETGTMRHAVLAFFARHLAGHA